jgi:adenylylsulfate reductase subunit B
MVLDIAQGKAYNREPDQCWECYACVKTCPQGAIAMRGYGDVVPLGASLVPLRGTDSIIWNVKFRNGELKRFRLPIRTTPWGSIEPYVGLSDPAPQDLKGPGLCGQERYLGVPQLPTLAKA